MRLQNKTQQKLRQYKKICHEEERGHLDDWQTIYCKKCGYDKYTIDKKNCIVSCNNCGSQTTVTKKKATAFDFFQQWRDFNDRFYDILNKKKEKKHEKK